MFLFLVLSFCCLSLLLNNFTKKQHHLKLPQVFDRILPFCWLFLPGVFLCARIFKGFSSDRGIWFQEKSCKSLAFWAQTGTLRMRPIQKWVHLKCYCTQGGVHILTEGVHILTHGMHILSVGMVFSSNFKLYNIFDHLLSCQNHHSKCMFSPHISVNHVKITLFIRYSNFFLWRLT